MPQSPDHLEPPPPPPELPPELPLSQPVLEQFKEDRRTRVWLAEGAGRQWVIKKYTDSQLRWQRLWLWGMGIHPAQKEWRRGRQLERDGLRVVRPVKMLWAGGLVHSIYPHGGESYQRMILKGIGCATPPGAAG